MVSQPKWSQDEWVIALEFYLRHKNRGRIPDKGSREIGNLSKTLRRLGMIRLSPDPKKFRNEAGVYMQVMKFKGLETKGKKGLGHPSQLAREVWEKHAADNLWVQQRAKTIVAAVGKLEKVTQEERIAAMDGIAVAKEGETFTQWHRVRERDRKIVERKKKDHFKENHALPCAVCAFDYFKTYGPHGNKYIECHHVKPLSSLPSARITYLKDLVLICASCHRMIHRKKEWLEVEQLRTMWEGGPYVCSGLEI